MKTMRFNEKRETDFINVTMNAEKLAAATERLQTKLQGCTITITELANLPNQGKAAYWTGKLENENGVISFIHANTRQIELVAKEIHANYETRDTPRAASVPTTPRAIVLGLLKAQLNIVRELSEDADKKSVKNVCKKAVLKQAADWAAAARAAKKAEREKSKTKAELSSALQEAQAAQAAQAADMAAALAALQASGAPIPEALKKYLK